MLRRFLLLVILISTLTRVSFPDYWVRQPTPTLAWLFRCTFTDTLNGWAAGDSGIIIHTSNGGLNWVKQNSTINYFIYSIQFINPRIGWGIAINYFEPFSTILHTTNGGVNWTAAFYPDSNVSLLTIHFLDSLNGWMSGFGGVFLQTTNGGQNWIPRERDSLNFSGFPVRNFAFYNSGFGFACGGLYDFGGVVWRSTNSGMLWNTSIVGPEPIFDLHIFDSLRAMGCGGDFEYGASVIKTSNGGINWDYTAFMVFGVAQAVAFRNDSEIWLPLGFSQRWAASFDSSNSWNEIQAPDSSSVYDALFLDESHGWACGTNGLIAKYIPRPIGIQNQQNIFPANNILYQNYPNPFNPYTTIEYFLIKPSIVRIKIYDILGREVKTIFNGPQKSGYHSLKFFGENLPSGVYFYKLEIEGLVETKKMILLK